MALFEEPGELVTLDRLGRALFLPGAGAGGL